MTRLLVTGYAKSGTHFIAHELRHAGLATRHETAYSHQYHGRWLPGQQAEVSCLAAPYTPMTDVYVVHLVRDPRLAIRSALLAAAAWDKAGRWNPTSEAKSRFIRDWILPTGRTPMARVAETWVAWNALVVANERIRLEDVDAPTITRLARLVSPTAGVDGLGPPRNVHDSDWPDVTWDDIDVPGLREMAEEYGYA